MKEIVISLLEDSELDRDNTAQIIKDALKPYVDAKRISYVGRDKYNYTKDEQERLVKLYIKLEDCEDKFLGAFQTEFAFDRTTFRIEEDKTYSYSAKLFMVQIGRLQRLSCLVHRMNGLKKEGHKGYDGKIMVKLEQVSKEFDNNDFELEPLPKHLKYFKDFSEFNPFDF